jgi:LBP / BPI / CETP family, C-terminal domain
VTKAAVDTIDFSAAVNAAIRPLFSAVPSTGQITTDIAFQFQEGPAGLTFPGDAGIVAGVTGVAMYRGISFSGPNPPTLPTPSIPAAKHLSYDVSDYSLNSLTWAFFSAGSLQRNVGPGDIPDPAVLNTANYKDTPLQALYDGYPDQAMTATITATSAPIVTFEQVYVITDAAYAALRPQLHPDAYTKLGALLHQPFLSEAKFFATLANDLGQAPAGQYKTIIEAAALTDAAVASSAQRVVLNVVADGTQIPVITFDVSQTDVLQDLVLGASGAAQSLKFSFQIVPDLTATTYVSSTVNGIDKSDFTFIWNWALQPAYAATMAMIGQAGVALPRIPGFDFLFDQASLTTQAGYINVITDVLHTTDAAMTMHLASKRIANGP